jgi:cytochrome c biogenesis protein ResB
MRRAVILLALVAIVPILGAVLVNQVGTTVHAQATTPDRVVVFESFMRST